MIRALSRCLLIALLAAAAGCASHSKPAPEPASRVQLPIDPDDPPAVVGWWSNGREIACVHESGLYVILPYPDPGAPPVQYGRWSRDSYAFIWLEPYNSPTYEKLRAPLKRHDGQVALVFPALAPMTATEDLGQVHWPQPESP